MAEGLDRAEFGDRDGCDFQPRHDTSGVTGVSDDLVGRRPARELHVETAVRFPRPFAFADEGADDDVAVRARRRHERREGDDHPFRGRISGYGRDHHGRGNPAAHGVEYVGCLPPGPYRKAPAPAQLLEDRGAHDREPTAAFGRCRGWRGDVFGGLYVRHGYPDGLDGA